MTATLERAFSNLRRIDDRLGRAEPDNLDRVAALIEERTLAVNELHDCPDFSSADLCELRERLLSGIEAGAQATRRLRLFRAAALAALSRALRERSIAAALARPSAPPKFDVLG